MSDVKRYEITWEHCTMYGNFIVEIDPHGCYFSHLMGLYEFCNNSKGHFPLGSEEDFQFNLVAITLKALAEKSLTLIVSNNWGLREVLRYFEDNGHYLGRGSGIEIIDVPYIPLHAHNMQVREISPCAAA
ncbi:hypothetical protein AAQ05_000295 [Salmonella enterica subsp. diarizonae]|nr:hypothetical protein [Salmonella enterica subsp. diarizonae]